MLYGPDGSRRQAQAEQARLPESITPASYFLATGIIVDVFTVDLVDSGGNQLNIPGQYLTYTVKMAPTGVYIHNVPAVMSGGHTQFYTNTQASNDLGHQNTEETPYVIGQPVLIGFLFGSHMNPIILGALACQMNAATVGPNGGNPILDEQTAGGSVLKIDPVTGASQGTYPQKQGSFQGTTWKIDKNGNPTVNIISNGTLKVEVNGIPFVTIDGANNLVDIGTGAEHGIMGDTLKTFLTNFISAFNSHTHNIIVPTPATPVTTPLVPATPPDNTILTQVLKVQ